MLSHKKKKPLKTHFLFCVLESGFQDLGHGQAKGFLELGASGTDDRGTIKQMALY